MLDLFMVLQDLLSWYWSGFTIQRKSSCLELSSRRYYANKHGRYIVPSKNATSLAEHYNNVAVDIAPIPEPEPEPTLRSVSIFGEEEDVVEPPGSTKTKTSCGRSFRIGSWVIPGIHRPVLARRLAYPTIIAIAQYA